MHQGRYFQRWQDLEKGTKEYKEVGVFYLVVYKFYKNGSQIVNDYSKISNHKMILKKIYI